MEGRRGSNSSSGVPVEIIRTTRIHADLTTNQRCNSLNTLGYENQVEESNLAEKIGQACLYEAVQSSTFQIYLREKAGVVIKACIMDQAGNGCKPMV